MAGPTLIYSGTRDGTTSSHRSTVNLVPQHLHRPATLSTKSLLRPPPASPPAPSDARTPSTTLLLAPMQLLPVLPVQMQMIFPHLLHALVLIYAGKTPSTTRLLVQTISVTKLLLHHPSGLHEGPCSASQLSTPRELPVPICPEGPSLLPGGGPYNADRRPILHRALASTHRTDTRPPLLLGTLPPSTQP